MTPVVLGKKECRQELIGVNRRTVLLCAASSLSLVLHFISRFESLTMTSMASSIAVLCIEVIWVATGYALFLKGKVSLVAVETIFVTIGGNILTAFPDYSSRGDYLFGDIPALAVATSCSVYTLIGCQVGGYISTTIYIYIVYVFYTPTLGLATVANRLVPTGYDICSVMVGFLFSAYSTLLGHSILSWYLKFLSLPFVFASKLCELAIVALFALPLFSEVPKPLQIVGGAVTIGGVLLYSQIEKKENDKRSCQQYDKCAEDCGNYLEKVI